MARTIDMTQVSSSGRGTNKYTSIYREVQGEAEVGDQIMLRDGMFEIVAIGMTRTSKTGFTETDLTLKKVESN